VNRCTRVCLDNVIYHRTRDPSSIKHVRSATKAELTEFLVSNGVKKLSVNRNGATHTFDSKRFTVNAPHGPYADELRTEANRLITANPGLCRTQIMTLLHDHTLRVHARRSSANPTSPALSPLHMKYTELLPQEQRSFVLHTLPYECDSQAIEKVWADVKRFVATQNTNTRTPAQVAQHLRWGFYGMSQSELSALLPGTKPPRQNGVSPICP